MFNKLDILPLSLYEFELPENIYRQLKKDCLSVDWDAVKTRGNAPEQGKTFIENSWHNKKKYHYITTFVNECLQEVLTDLEFDVFRKLCVSLMWPNKSIEGQWHHTHNHGWSFLSGIIYVSGTTGRTWFSRCSEYMGISNFQLKLNKEIANDHDLIYKKEPKPGTLIIFPSTLCHSVDEVRNNEERITIGFNSFPTGEIGSIKNLAGLKIELK